MSDPEEVLAALAEALEKALGADLVSAAVHGSWVSGDFAPERSDLDVLVLLATEPTAATGELLAGVHDELDRRFPSWRERLDVHYVAVRTVAAAVAGDPDSGSMIMVGHGEPLHVEAASGHHLIGWAAAISADRPLTGRAPSELLDEVDPQLVDAVIMDHVRQWPDWVREMPTPPAQAYSVLTLCRAVEVIADGRQISKRAAAQRCATRFPEWGELIEWAVRCWYAPGSPESELNRFDDTVRFVTDLSDRLTRR